MSGTNTGIFYRKMCKGELGIYMYWNPLYLKVQSTSYGRFYCIDFLYFRSSTEGCWRSILKFSWNKGSTWFKCQAKFLGPTWTAEEQRYQGDNGTQMVLNFHVVQLLRFSQTCELWSLKAAFIIAIFTAVNHNYDHKQRTLNHRNTQNGSKSTNHKSETMTFWTC